MKLLHATIYGFGKWIDYSIDLSSDSALCIYGENESGKSTLQKFILFMLFGLPPKQRNFYRPKTSGKMGGKLKIYDPTHGNYTIERLDEVKNGLVTCYTDDGMIHDEAWLKERLQGMTYQTYQSIFSFSAMDLSQVREMKEDDLGEVLLSIGLTGANNIYAIEKKIDSQMGTLFKPYGKKPAINQQLASIDQLFVSLNRFKSEAVTYREKKEKAAQLKVEMEQLQMDLQAEKSEHFATQRQVQALPVMRDYQYYSAQLEKYPDTITFPENGVDRLEQLKEKLLPLQSELAVLKHHEKSYRDKIHDFEAKQTDEKMYLEAAAIIGQKQEYDETKKALEKVQASMNKLTVQLDTEIQQLNIGLQLADLDNITFPFHVENTWQEIKNDVDQLDIKMEQLKQEENELKQQHNFLLNQMQELDDVCLSPDKIQQFREKVNQYQELDVWNRLTKESDQREQAWKKTMTAKDKYSRTLFIGSIILSILAGLAAISFTLTWLFPAMMLIFIIGTAQWLWGKHTTKQMKQMLASKHSQPPEARQITEQEKEHAVQLLALNEQNRTEYDSLKEQEKARDIQYIKWNEKKKMLEEKEKQVHAQIDVQLETYPFLQHVAITYWPEIFHRMKHLLNNESERKKVIAETKLLEDKLDNYQLKATEFLQKINKYTRNQSLESQLEIIGERNAMYEDTQLQISHYESLLMDCHDQQQDTGQQLKPYIAEKKALLATAQVDTENAYYEKANQLAEKQQVVKAQEKLKDQLDKIFPEQIGEGFVDNQTDQDKLVVKQERTVEIMEGMEQAIEAIRQQLAEVNAELSTMESSETYSETLHEYAMEQEQLSKLAKEWAVLKTAKEMLIETMRIYRDKYLNKVMEATSAYFSHLTDDSYRKVFAPIGDQPFQVEMQDGTRYTVNELSQGTVDQLYVSLRIAISEIMSEKHCLPFIIDDAFVHFDALRTRRMIEILESISKGQQIILFTCKKEVIAATKDAKVIHLADEIPINE